MPSIRKLRLDSQGYVMKGQVFQTHYYGNIPGEHVYVMETSDCRYYTRRAKDRKAAIAEFKASFPGEFK